METSQTRIKNTPTIGKDVARYKSKLRGLARKQTGKLYRSGTTFRLKLVL